MELTDVRRTIPAQCYSIHPVQAWKTVARVFACVGIGAITLFWLDPMRLGAWAWPLLMALWILQGWTLVGLFVLGHDCGHQSFSRSSLMNELVGTICFAPLGNAYRTWQITHNHHHAWTQLRGQDVDWAEKLVTPEEYARSKNWITKIGYALPYGVFFWIFHNLIRRALLAQSILRDPHIRRRVRFSGIIMLLIVTMVYVGLWRFVGLWGLLRIHAIPALIAMITGQFIIAIQHAGPGSLLFTRAGWTPLRGQLDSTFDVRFPRFIEWLWCKINIHTPHHVAPSIPWYHLELAAQAIRDRYPDLAKERRFGWHDVIWFQHTPFLRERPGRECYELVNPRATFY